MYIASRKGLGLWEEKGCYININLGVVDELTPFNIYDYYVFPSDDGDGEASQKEKETEIKEIKVSKGFGYYNRFYKDVPSHEDDGETLLKANRYYNIDFNHGDGDGDGADDDELVVHEFNAYDDSYAVPSDNEGGEGLREEMREKEINKLRRLCESFPYFNYYNRGFDDDDDGKGDDESVWWGREGMRVMHGDSNQGADDDELPSFNVCDNYDAPTPSDSDDDDGVVH